MCKLPAFRPPPSPSTSNTAWKSVPSSLLAVVNRGNPDYLHVKSGGEGGRGGCYVIPAVLFCCCSPPGACLCSRGRKLVPLTGDPAWNRVVCNSDSQKQHLVCRKSLTLLVPVPVHSQRLHPYTLQVCLLERPASMQPS
jgi:hypothetical protein